MSTATVLVVAVVATEWILAGCNLNLANSGNNPDAAVGTSSCLEIRNCIREQCQGTTPDKDCVSGCIGAGSGVAQSQYRTLSSCLVGACCTDQGGCGGGSSKCSATGTPQCESCTCQAQCDPTSAPCRKAATQCYGSTPDCSACK